MIFSSMVFICVFLPLVLFFYYIVPAKCKNYVLLFFSFAFYAWGEPKVFFVMLFIIILNYFSAALIERFEKQKFLLLVIALLLNFGALFYFKYFDFSIRLVNKILHRNFSLKNILLPAGISFYIFQSVSYTIDVFRKETPAQKNIFSLALYISFFPQLIAGPIVKYHEINSQLDNRFVSIEHISTGVKRFILGLCKKVLIANTLASEVDEVFSSSNLVLGTRSVLIVTVVAYALQIFYDFSGYSDMAIGLGKMFGFDFLENFNYPYISQSVTEFWRRWHISLSTWFKEYLYIPLGGNRVTKLRNLFNIFVVFLCTGIWHGAAYTFVLWGLWHGTFNIFEKITGLNKDAKNIFIKALKIIYTLFVVLVGWIFFRANGLHDAIFTCLKIFGLKTDNGIFGMSYFFNTYTIFIFVVGILFAFPIAPFIKNKLSLISEKNKAIKNIFSIFYDVLLLILFVYSLSCLASGTYNPFIYFRF